MANLKLPMKVVVTNVESHRYDNKVAPGTKPSNWDNRVSGEDVVSVSCEAINPNSAQKENSNMKIKLSSKGDQCIPAPGWSLMLTEGSSENGYEWTLYGFDRNSSAIIS